MNWVEFVVAYSLGAAILALLLTFFTEARPARLLRLLTLMLALAFFVDQAAESRKLWAFPMLSLSQVLDVPLENLLFSLATTIYALTAHLLSKALLDRRKSL